MLSLPSCVRVLCSARILLMMMLLNELVDFYGCQWRVRCNCWVSGCLLSIDKQQVFGSDAWIWIFILFAVVVVVFIIQNTLDLWCGCISNVYLSVLVFFFFFSSYILAHKRNINASVFFVKLVLLIYVLFFWYFSLFCVGFSMRWRIYGLVEWLSFPRAIIPLLLTRFSAITKYKREEKRKNRFN